MQRTMGMGMRVMGMVMLAWWASFVSSAMECGTVTQAFSVCYAFITYGSPDPIPGTPCCDAVSGLDVIANSSSDDKRSACRCLMGLIASYNPNFSAIATLPAFCGISLGFTIQPDIDCNSYVSLLYPFVQI